MQVEALVDSGATTTFINKSVVETHNLVTYRLATPFNVLNAEGTSNKHGRIQDSVRAYLEIGSHKSNNHMLVTDLGNKDMIIGLLRGKRSTVKKKKKKLSSVLGLSVTIDMLFLVM